MRRTYRYGTIADITYAIMSAHPAYNRMKVKDIATCLSIYHYLENKYSSMILSELAIVTLAVFEEMKNTRNENY